MSINFIETLIGFKPLVFVGEKILFYKNGWLFEYKNQLLIPQIRFGTCSWKDNCRIATRFFRREPKYAKAIDEKRILIVYQHKILLVDLEDKTIKTISSNRDGFSDPLNICIALEKWVAIWGDYGINATHSHVHIYGLKKDLSVEIIYQFPAGAIRHVHNIIPTTNGYYILTGDNESQAGIYKTDSHFQCIIPLLTGKQQYRAVIGFSTKKGLLYATDAVNEKNHLYLLRHNNELTPISQINGSCIYGRKYGDDYWFSTTVEPDETNHGIFSWISRKKGTGILSNEVHLIKVTEDLEVETVLKLKKDIYPMKLMQYGSIQFPNGDSNEKWIYPVAVKRNDGCAIKIG